MSSSDQKSRKGERTPLPSFQPSDVTRDGSSMPPKASRSEHERQPIAGIRNIIAIASGKGGVGKSTVAVNLALALVHKGKKVGICDTDIYGPSMPLMLGIREKPMGTPDRKILPLERFGLKVMSIGFLVPQDTAVIWRGPMVMKMVQEFLRNVAWGPLDYLILDLPPALATHSSRSSKRCRFRELSL